MSDTIRSLEPKLLWEHFYQISQIPRCSKDEERVRQYVISVAERHGLEYRSDAIGSIIVKKPATAGMENAPIVILQSHLDMVCEKNKDTKHDFSKDPIRLLKKGDWVMADGTTLGADNGIGVAASLAVMESTDITHGPLEILFTIDEETGLTGAMKLGNDMLEGRILLNMDSEEDGVFYIGCAGGRDTEIFFDYQPEAIPAGYQAARIRLAGLKGGHSGAQIHEGLGNAIKLTSRFLADNAEALNLRLAFIDGGSKHNAIPRECDAIVYLPAARLAALQDSAAAAGQVYREELRVQDPGVSLQIDQDGFEKPDKLLPLDSQKRLLNMLQVMPHGVQGMSFAVPGLVETSTNLAVIKTHDSRIAILTSQRSSVASALQHIADVVATVGIQAGAEIEFHNGYPGWQPDPESPILQTATKLWKKKYGDDLEIMAIHAGLECGIIGDKFPGMDMLSFGPTITGAHSPDEQVQVSATAKFWEFLTALLGHIQ